MPVRLTPESAEQAAQQRAYLDLIDNSVLKDYVQSQRTKPLWYLGTTEGNDLKKADKAKNTENRLKALNSARYIRYSEDEYRQLLTDVGLTVGSRPQGWYRHSFSGLYLQELKAWEHSPSGPDQLSHPDFCRLYSENRQAVERFSQQDSAQRLALFEAIYRALRKQEAKFFAKDFSKAYLQVAEAARYAFIEQHVKQRILQRKQSRSVDVWYLLQDVLSRRYDLRGLATALVNIAASASRRASDMTNTKAEARQKAMDTIADELRGVVEAVRVEASAAPRPNNAAIREVIAQYQGQLPLDIKWCRNKNLHAISSQLSTTINLLLAKEIKQSRDKDAWSKWQDRLRLGLLFCLDKRNAGEAISFYFFHKTSDPHYCPSEQVIESLMAATNQTRPAVLPYLDGFMVEGQSAWAAHRALVTAQLGLDHVWPECFNALACPYVDTLVALWAEFAHLLTLTQTPVPLFLASLTLAPGGLPASAAFGRISHTLQTHLQALSELKQWDAETPKALLECQKEIRHGVDAFEHEFYRAEQSVLQHRREVEAAAISDRIAHPPQIAEAPPVANVSSTATCSTSRRVGGVNLSSIQLIKFAQVPGS